METGKIRIKTYMDVYEPLQTLSLSAKLIAIIGRFSVIIFIIEVQNSEFNTYLTLTFTYSVVRRTSLLSIVI